jgi:hypothetical protein
VFGQPHVELAMKLAFFIRILSGGAALAQEAFSIDEVTSPALNEV